MNLILKYNNSLKITKVSPSAHLWKIIAKEIPKTFDISVSMPIARPSNVAWIPMAICKINGAISLACFCMKLCPTINNYIDKSI